MIINRASGGSWIPPKGSVLLGIFLGALVLNSPPFLIFLFAQTGEARTISAENDRFVVELVGPGEPRYDPGSGGRVKFTFMVTDQGEARQYPITLDNITSEIQEIRFAGDQLIVFGSEATHHSSIITIMNPENGTVIDSMMGFEVSLSGSGRYLSYRKFYPSLGSAPALRSDLVLVYDLADSPAGNRLRDMAVYRSDPIGRLIEVGRPVYPEENIGKTNYRVWVRSKNRRHSIVPNGIFWLKEDRGVVFIDRVSGENNLILVDLSAGIDRPVVYKKWIDLPALMRAEDVGDEARLREAKQLRLEDVKELEDGLIWFRISSEAVLAKNELQVSMEEFLTGQSYDELYPSEPMEEDERSESDHH